MLTWAAGGQWCHSPRWGLVKKKTGSLTGQGLTELELEMGRQYCGVWSHRLLARKLYRKIKRGSRYWHTRTNQQRKQCREEEEEPGETVVPRSRRGISGSVCDRYVGKDCPGLHPASISAKPRFTAKTWSWANCSIKVSISEPVTRDKYLQL